MSNHSLNKFRNLRYTAAAAVIVFAASFAIGGCGSSNYNRSNINGGYDAYNQDGYLGYSNSNPSLPNRQQTRSYGSDSTFVHQVLRPMKGIDNVRLLYNGDRLDVHLKVNKGLSDRQIRKLRMDAQSKIQFNMPRYEVHVLAERSK